MKATLVVGLLVLAASGSPAVASTGECERRWTFPVPFFQSVAWSPDGSKIAYAAVTTSWDDGYRIFVLDVASGVARKLDTGGGAALFPAFSPDGSKIAYQGRRDGNSDVWVVAVSGGDPVRLTEHEASDGYPTWSPDGTRIAFHSDRDGDYEIWVMNADGSEPRSITDHPSDDYNPSWSPDGDWIAFDSDRDEVDGDELYVTDPGGAGVTRVADQGVFPTWSPDSQRILFTLDGLYELDIAVDQSRRLLEHAVYGAWSPDGGSIAAAATSFDAGCEDHHALILMAPDGGGQRQLAP